MSKLFLSVLFFLFLAIFSQPALAQEESQNNIVHVQVWKLKSNPMGDDAAAFNEMLRQQSSIMNSDSRVINSYVLRHYWGADSRDLVMIAEFKNITELTAFYDDLDDLMEKAFSKEELDKGDALFMKYVGHHSDEIYMQSPGTGN